VNQSVGVWQEEPEKGEVYVVASAVDSDTGQQVREAKVKASAGKVTPDAIEKLALFVSKGNAPPPVEAVVTRPTPVPPELDLAASPSSSLRVESRVPRPGARTAAYVTGGAAIAAIGVGVYGLVTASSRQREMDGLLVNGTLPPESEQRQDELRKQVNVHRVVGWVGLGAGVAAAGAAVGLYLYSGSKPTASKVKVGLTPSAVTLSGRF
jgi:hypothetical protein